jgi:hypothetical protein
MKGTRSWLRLSLESKEVKVSEWEPDACGTLILTPMPQMCL